MIDLQPCLATCDQALVEAELLIARLAACPPELVPELTLARERITSLRREVERLRGMRSITGRLRVGPEWTKSTSRTPWCAEGA